MIMTASSKFPLQVCCRYFQAKPGNSGRANESDMRPERGDEREETQTRRGKKRREEKRRENGRSVVPFSSSL